MDRAATIQHLVADSETQGAEGAPDAGLEVISFAAQGLHGLQSGQDIIVLTWLHRSRRDVLKVHPRSDRRRPLTGVFDAISGPGRTQWDFIAPRCGGSPRIGCGLVPSKPSTVRPSSTSNRCFLPPGLLITVASYGTLAICRMQSALSRTGTRFQR
jgi:hypothetical protein